MLSLKICMDIADRCEQGYAIPIDGNDRHGELEEPKGISEKASEKELKRRCKDQNARVFQTVG